ncbi:hypothetical protein WA026_021504 [Henosepilachna vigintioctopunctata]|uniref:Peptidase A2 domain-containing protein n=1 Tax=Henosepilachna vigintioctopunctata TaxID=420089 RepID=A0AAW1UR70_9CUCU
MSLGEIYQKLNNDLKTFRDNLRKDNTARRTDEEVINRKFKDLDKFKDYLAQVDKKLDQKVIDKEINDSSIEQILEMKDQINDKINNSLKILSTRRQETQATDQRTASSLLPKLDGKIETTHHLIECIELYESALDQINKPLLVNYVLKACIGHVEKIRLKQSYNSVDELIADIKTHFLPKQSASALAARLQACQQGSTDIEEYGRSIEILMSELTIAQAGNDARALEIFKGANEKIAVDVFARGIKNFETRTIIKSRNFNKLSDAINAAKEEAVLHQQNASVLHFRDQYRGQGLNFVRMNYDQKEIILLVDTGASVSVLFKTCVNQNEKVNKENTIKINGISRSTTASGTVNISLQVGKNDIKHTFVIIEPFNYAIDGILGSDFFEKYYASID